MKTALKDILHVYDLVKELMVKHAIYRDNDRKLVAHVWAIQCGGVHVMEQIRAYDFLTDYCRDEDRYSSYDSITRSRRKVQEKHPELRGEKWKLRAEQEKEVRYNVPNL